MWAEKKLYSTNVLLMDQLRAMCLENRVALIHRNKSFNILQHGFLFLLPDIARRRSVDSKRQFSM